MDYWDIDYLKEEQYRAVLCNKKEIVEIYRVNEYLNKLFKKHLINLSEYKKLVNKKVNIAIRPPLYLDEKLLLWQIKIDDNIYYINWMNVCNILKEENKLHFYFCDGYTLDLVINNRKYARDKQKLISFINYINQQKNINIAIDYLA